MEIGSGSTVIPSWKKSQMALPRWHATGTPQTPNDGFLPMPEIRKLRKLRRYWRGCGRCWGIPEWFAWPFSGALLGLGPEVWNRLRLACHLLVIGDQDVQNNQNDSEKIHTVAILGKSSAGKMQLQYTQYHEKDLPHGMNRYSWYNTYNHLVSKFPSNTASVLDKTIFPLWLCPEFCINCIESWSILDILQKHTFLAA